MAEESYDSQLEQLHRRLQMLGKVLSVLCCVWIAVVGTVLVRDMTSNDLEHHRAPITQDRMAGCQGDFAKRYACADAILIRGQHNGATEILTRMGVTMILPTIAWFMWRRVMARAEQLR
jgi:hypothetical protein